MARYRDIFCFPRLFSTALILGNIGREFCTARAACWKGNNCDVRFTEAAFPGHWNDGILAPSSRTVTPAFVVINASTLAREPFSPSATPLHLRGNGSQLVLDFGLEVGGLITVEYSVSGKSTYSGNENGSLGLAFSETSEFIGQWSDASNGAFQGPDGAIYSDFGGSGSVTYKMPDVSLRGGFRYLTLFLVTAAAADDFIVTVKNVTLDIAIQPTWPNLRAYQGYFDCDDEQLNRIWYAGAYTLQTNAVPPDTGRHAPVLAEGWANDGQLGPGYTILVDGAKRDRTVWAGDMGVAVPSMFVSTGDLESVQNALQTMYDCQNSDGSFPESGPPFLIQGAGTYHMWTMIGTYNYMLYTNDTDFVARNWAKYLQAMDFITGRQTYSSGLLDVTGTDDWARFNVGANMTEAQVLLYHTFVTGAALAAWADPTGQGTALAAKWTAAADKLRNATLEACYDSSHGAFRDNATDTTLHPQDANSLALAFGMVGSVSNSSSLAQNISSSLTENWGGPDGYGPNSPEMPGNVSPFISSWEVRGHFAVGQTVRALSLIRTLWGRYLDRTDGSQSTFVEGFLVNGSFGYRYDHNLYGGPNNTVESAASYTSQSHGWSTGPTSALTEFVLGLSIVGLAGSAWRFAPQLGDLGRAEGGFVMAVGKFRACWVRSTNGYEASVESPLGTAGTLVLPISEDSVNSLTVVLDGQTVAPAGYQFVPSMAPGVSSTVVLSVAGGNHTLRVTYLTELKRSV